MQLYGFKTASERKLFVHFISVSGVGPKLGIALLSHGKADDLIESIKSNNLARLTQIPGIGRKTAERLVVDLRDKMIQLSQAQVAEQAGTNQKRLTYLPKTRFAVTRFRHSSISAINVRRRKKRSTMHSVKAATSRSSRSSDAV